MRLDELPCGAAPGTQRAPCQALHLIITFKEFRWRVITFEPALRRRCVLSREPGAPTSVTFSPSPPPLKVYQLPNHLQYHFLLLTRRSGLHLLPLTVHFTGTCGGAGGRGALSQPALGSGWVGVSFSLGTGTSCIFHGTMAPGL